MPESEVPRARRFATWAIGSVFGAILAGLGAYVWANAEGWLEDRKPPLATDVAPPEIDLLADPGGWGNDQPNWVPYFYFLPVQVGSLTEPPQDCRDRREWAWEQGGADADESRLRLTVTGVRDGEVSLDSMSVDVESRPLPEGIVAACPVGGASGSVHGLVVDLQARSVRFVVADETAPARFTLRKGETEAFDIYAVGYDAPRLYTWNLTLTVVAGGDRRTITVDDNGRPFRTAGAAAAGTRMVVWKNGAWRKYNPGGL